MAKAKVGIDVAFNGQNAVNDISKFIDKIDQLFSALSASIKVDADSAFSQVSKSADKATAAAKEYFTGNIEASKNAATLLTEQDDKINAAREKNSIKYERDEEGRIKNRIEAEKEAAAAIEAALEKISLEKIRLSNAAKNATDKDTKEELAAKKRALDEEAAILKRVSQENKKAAKEEANSRENAEKEATRLIAAEEEKLSNIRKKYEAKYEYDSKGRIKNKVKAEKDAAHEIVEAIHSLSNERLKIQLAEAKAEDRITKQTLAEKKKAIAEELKMLRQVAHENEQISRGGEGGKVGILGTGRQFLKEKSPVANMLLGGSGGGDGDGGGMAGMAGKAAMYGAVAGVAAAALKQVISIGSEYEDQLLDLQAIVGTTDEETKDFGNRARELGIKFGVDAKEGVEAFKLVVSALGPGVAKDKEALTSMGESVMTLAKAAGVDAATAADSLTITLNQFGYANVSAAEKAKQMQRIMNAMAAGAKEGAAEVPQLSESMKAVGVIASQSGLSIEQTVAAIEVYSQAGIKGAEAGTALRNVLSLTASGSKEAKEQLAKIGLTFADVNPKQVGLATSMKRLNAGIESLTDETEKAEFRTKLFGRENAAAGSILMQNVDNYEALTEAVTGTDTATEQMEIKNKSFNASIQKIVVQLKDFALTLYDFLRPSLSVIIDIASVLIKVLIWFHEIEEKVVGGVWNIIKAFGEWLYKVLDVRAQIDKFISSVVHIYNVVADAVIQVYNWAMSYDAVRKSVEKVVEWIKTLIGWAKDAWDWISKVAGGGDGEKTGAAKAAAETVAASSTTATPAATAETATATTETNDPVIDKIKKTAGKGEYVSDKKEKKKKPEDILKEQYAAEKNVILRSLDDQLFEIQLIYEKGDITEAERKRRELEQRKEHNERLLQLYNQYVARSQKFATDNADELHALNQSTRKNDIDLDKAKYAEQKDIMERELDDQVKVIEDRLEQGTIKSGEAKRDEINLQIAHNEKLLTIAKEHGLNTLAIEKTVFNLRRALLQISEKEAEKEANQKLKADTQRHALQVKLEKERLKSQDATVKRDRELAELDYLEEQKKIKDTFYDKEEQALALQELEERHQNDIRNIEDKYYQDNLNKNKDFYAKLEESSRNGTAKQFLLQKMGLDQSLSEITKSKSLELLTWITTEYQKTAATEAGVFQRIGMVAIEIWSNVKSAASSAFSAVMSAVEWISKLVPWPWNLALIPVGIATVTGAYFGVKKILGFEQGGKVSGGKQIIVVNENGEEVVINNPATSGREGLLNWINRNPGKPIPTNEFSDNFITPTGELGKPVNFDSGVPDKPNFSVVFRRSIGMTDAPINTGDNFISPPVSSGSVVFRKSVGRSDVPVNKVPANLGSVVFRRSIGRSDMPINTGDNFISPPVSSGSVVFRKSVGRSDVPVNTGDNFITTPQLNARDFSTPQLTGGTDMSELISAVTSLKEAFTEQQTIVLDTYKTQVGLGQSKNESNDRKFK